MTKILLVEDDKSLREIYGVRLLAEGYDIVSAGDGEEALAMAIKDRPDLILSDVMMPKISGFDMLDILRSTTETKGIKVIMMTALSSEDQRQRGVALGADRYLVKSQVGIEDVVRTVHEVLADAPVAGTTPTLSSAPRPPQPQPQPAPAPTTPAPQPQPQTPAPSSELPQPTAPFSTNRPANLADRVIQPLNNQPEARDFTSMIDRELADTPKAAAPTPEPLPAPSQPAETPSQSQSEPAIQPFGTTSQQPAPSPQFGETPRPQPAPINPPLQTPPTPQPPTFPGQGPTPGV